MNDYRVFKIRQRFDPTHLADPRAAIREALAALDGRIRPGARIAVGVGSRGLDNLALLVKELCAFLKERGAIPFVVPAMGSHGGATGGGQREVLSLYGVSEETVGAPVVASMDVV